jgi:hypothetical protein
MRTLMSAFVAVAVMGGIVHVSGPRSLEGTVLVLTAHIDTTQDMGPAAPGPTDPSGPSA